MLVDDVEKRVDVEREPGDATAQRFEERVAPLLVQAEESEQVGVPGELLEIALARNEAEQLDRHPRAAGPLDPARRGPGSSHATSVTSIGPSRTIVRASSR